MKRNISKILAIVMVVSMLGGLFSACRKKDYTEVKKIRKEYDEKLEDYEELLDEGKTDEDLTFIVIMDEILDDSKTNDKDIELELAWRAEKLCMISLKDPMVIDNYDYMDENEKALEKLMGKDVYQERLEEMEDVKSAVEAGMPVA